MSVSDEIGQRRAGRVRTALTAAMRGLDSTRQASDEQAAGYGRRMDARTAANRAHLAQVEQSAWWEHATPEAIADVYARAAAGEAVDRYAHAARERMDEELMRRYGIDTRELAGDRRVSSSAVTEPSDVAVDVGKLAQAREELAKAERARDAAAEALDEARHRYAVSATGTGAAHEPSTHYADVFEWYEHWFRFVYDLRIDGTTRIWHARWWDYAGARVRLEAIWRAWEDARHDPARMSSWFLEHADPHMAWLTDPETSPFAGDDPDDAANRSDGGQLPYEQPPAALRANFGDGVTGPSAP